MSLLHYCCNPEIDEGSEIIAGHPRPPTNSIEVAPPVKTTLKRIDGGRKNSGRKSVIDRQTQLVNSGHLYIGEDQICHLAQVAGAVVQSAKKSGWESAFYKPERRRGVLALNEASVAIQKVLPDAVNETKLAEAGDAIVTAEKEERDNFWEMIATLSSLCIYPEQMAKVCAQLVTIVAGDNDKLLESKINAPLLFTFALRNALTRLAFGTLGISLVKEVLQGLFKKSKESKPFYGDDTSLSDTFVFVGFNRLFSPNNNCGVSYSSDIDYKLIIDSDKIKSKLAPKNVDVEGLVKDLQTAQETLKAEFDKHAKLLLEVENFTTRTLEDLRNDIHKSETEKNFLASIFKNNIYIAGSTELHSDFKGLLESKRDGLEIAKRTWVQYLGASDKGSIKWLAKTKEVKGIIDNAASLVLDKEDNRHVVRNFLMKKYGQSPSSMQSWLASPRIFKAFLGNNEGMFVKILQENLEFSNKIASLGMFEGIDNRIEKLKRVAKVCAGMVDDNTYKPEEAAKCLCQIGSKSDLSTYWRFSLKYAGCRLNDFFDSVEKEDLVEWWDKKDQESIESIEKMYERKKEIAEAINSFSLGMQNCIYLGYMHQYTHEEIDVFYSRITKEGFCGIVKEENARASLIQHLKTLINALHAASLPDVELKESANDLLRNFENKNHPDEVTEKAKIFFVNLFKLTQTTAFSLNPEIISL